jgi:DNA polymerase-3 subunit epsilon
VPWPFDGPVAFAEGSVLHVVDGWAYLGMASDLDYARRLAATSRGFDHDVYRLLVGRVEQLGRDCIRL